RAGRRVERAGHERGRADRRETGGVPDAEGPRAEVKVVVTAKNGTRDFEVEPGEKILLAGLRHGVELSYECATGTCGTCKAKLVDGCVENQWIDAPGRKYCKTAPELLTCQTIATSDCAFEIGGAFKTR